jgi:hypothetical protein
MEPLAAYSQARDTILKILHNDMYVPAATESAGLYNLLIGGALQIIVGYSMKLSNNPRYSEYRAPRHINRGYIEMDIGLKQIAPLFRTILLSSNPIFIKFNNYITS